MDLCQYGGSNLESKALERALKRRKNKDSHQKARERPLLARANAIRRDEERDALRPPPVVTQTQPHRLSQSKRPPNKEGGENNNENGEDGVIESGTSIDDKKTLTQERASSREKVRPSSGLQIIVPLVSPTESMSPLPSPLFPHSPFDDTPLSGETSPHYSQGGVSPRNDSLARSNTFGESLLDPDEVSVYTS